MFPGKCGWQNLVESLVLRWPDEIVDELEAGTYVQQLATLDVEEHPNQKGQEADDSNNDEEIQPSWRSLVLDDLRIDVVEIDGPIGMFMLIQDFSSGSHSFI